MKHYQPTGLCDNCLKLNGDPCINCPKAQAIRETGVAAEVKECGSMIPALLRKSNAK